MGCDREAGSSTAHPFHVVRRGALWARDEDLNGAEVRTLKEHVGNGERALDEGHAGDARDEGLGGDVLWRTPRMHTSIMNNLHA